MPNGGDESELIDIEKGAVVKPETAKLMVSNQNGQGLTPRGLGFNVGTSAGAVGCSAKTFGHSGSTGTLAGADPANDLICIVLTSLPTQAVKPHQFGFAARSSLMG